MIIRQYSNIYTKAACAARFAGKSMAAKQLHTTFINSPYI